MARKTLFHIFAESCDGGDGSWAGYLHAGLMFLFTGLELQSCRGMPPVQRGRDGSDESKQRIIYLQKPVGAGARGVRIWRIEVEDRPVSSECRVRAPRKNLTVNIYH